LQQSKGLMQVVTTQQKITANATNIFIPILINYNQMNHSNLKDIKTTELKNINGGGLVGLAIGVTGLVLACATALGYYNGKKDCIPPPCTDK